MIYAHEFLAEVQLLVIFCGQRPFFFLSTINQDGNAMHTRCRFPCTPHFSVDERRGTGEGGGGVAGSAQYK